MTLDATIVVPTVGRESLGELLTALQAEDGTRPAEIIVVDDRAAPRPLSMPGGLPLRVLTSGGRGPAAARNLGWRASATRWVCFLDDDVLPAPGWLRALHHDLTAAESARAAGSQGELHVPRTGTDRAPTDDERRTLRLAGARWITADMTYRRDVLVQTGGFDERFPRAYREDFRSRSADRLIRTPHRQRIAALSASGRAGHLDDLRAGPGR